MFPISQSSVYNWERILTVQSGRGLVGYRGATRYQRGSGLGSIFRSIFKIAKPLAKSVLKNVAKEGLATAVNVGSDLLEGENIKESLKSHTKRAGKRLIKRGTKAMKSKIQKGGARRIGYKRRRKATKKRKKQIGHGRKKYKRTRKTITKRRKHTKKSDYLGLIH